MLSESLWFTIRCDGFLYQRNAALHIQRNSPLANGGVQLIALLNQSAADYQLVYSGGRLRDWENHTQCTVVDVRYPDRSAAA